MLFISLCLQAGVRPKCFDDFAQKRKNIQFVHSHGKVIQHKCITRLSCI